MVDLDGNGEPKTGANRHDRVIKYKYNKNGQAIQVTDALGNATVTEYDTLGRVAKTTDALGNKSIIVYDKRSLPIEKRIEASDESIISTYSSYDKDGRQIKTWQTLNGQELSTKLVYNKLNQIIETTDASNNVTEYTYDYRGKVLTETKHLNNTPITTTYAYDKSGNLLSVIDANNNTTTYKYDGFGRQIEEISPDGKKTLKTYDENSNILTQTDPNGTLITNTYDALNRLTHRVITRAPNIKGTTEETYTYDSLGHLTSANDGKTLLEFMYD